MDKGLVVELPLRHIKNLSERFNIGNFEFDDCWEEYTNRQPCVLCGVHLRNGECNKCPFEKFTTSTTGCWIWLKKIKAITCNCVLEIGTDTIEFPRDKYKTAVKQLKRLKDTAEQYIIWK